MFEFAIQGPTRIRLRVGRLHFRTWRSRLMVLPRGYRAPDNIYSVVVVGGDPDDVGLHLGTFYSEWAAEECIKRLRAEGNWGDLALSFDVAHYRTQDWEFDR